MAIRWVAQAWSLVKPETIRKCFHKAGVLDKGMEVVSQGDEGDPFLEVDELQCMIDQAMGAEGCRPEEYLNGDDDIPVGLDTSDDTWEDNFMSSIGNEQDDEEDDDEHNHEVPETTSAM